MADTLSDILIKILEELSPEELERFKFYLTKEDKPLARGKQGVSLTQLVQNMERVYTDKGSIDRTRRILEKMDLCDLVQQLNQKMEGQLSKSDPSPSQKQDNFFTKHKAALETRMNVRPVLIKLEDCGILIGMEREDVESERTPTMKNHALIVLLSKRGKAAQEKFHQILRETDPFLVDDLESS